jgi:hypothetical protein
MGLQEAVFKNYFLPQIKNQEGGSPGVPRGENCGAIDNQQSEQPLRHALPDGQRRG